MKKKKLICLLLIVLAGILVLSVSISSKKRQIEQTVLTSNGEIIEDISTLPPGAQELFAQYKDSLKSELGYMQVARGMLALAFILFAVEYVRRFGVKKEDSGE